MESLNLGSPSKTSDKSPISTPDPNTETGPDKTVENQANSDQAPSSPSCSVDNSSSDPCIQETADPNSNPQVSDSQNDTQKQSLTPEQPDKNHNFMEASPERAKKESSPTLSPNPSQQELDDAIFKKPTGTPPRRSPHKKAKSTSPIGRPMNLKSPELIKLLEQPPQESGNERPKSLEIIPNWEKDLKHYRTYTPSPHFVEPGVGAGSSSAVEVINNRSAQLAFFADIASGVPRLLDPKLNLQSVVVISSGAVVSPEPQEPVEPQKMSPPKSKPKPRSVFPLDPPFRSSNDRPDCESPKPGSSRTSRIRPAVREKAIDSATETEPVPDSSKESEVKNRKLKRASNESDSDVGNNDSPVSNLQDDYLSTDAPIRLFEDPFQTSAELQEKLRKKLEMNVCQNNEADALHAVQQMNWETTAKDEGLIPPTASLNIGEEEVSKSNVDDASEQ